jgi:hypothetical protein
MKEKIRYAVIGLGHIAQTAVLPAFQHAENSELVALVTRSPDKAKELSKRYGVNAYGYDDLEIAIDREKSTSFTSPRRTRFTANRPSAPPAPAVTSFAKNRWLRLNGIAQR